MIDSSTLLLPSLSPSSTAGQDPEQRTHEQYHADFLRGIEQNIYLHRDALGIEPTWVIKAQICCPGELLFSEGTIGWDSSIRYAVLKIRCDLFTELLQSDTIPRESLAMRILIHELYELLFWESGDVFLSLLNLLSGTGINTARLRDYLDMQYRAARNRQIELLTTKFLGCPRPGHLMMETPFVDSSLSSPVYSPAAEKKQRQFMPPFEATK